MRYRPLLSLAMVLIAHPSCPGVDQGTISTCDSDCPTIDTMLGTLGYYSDPVTAPSEALSPEAAFAIITATADHLGELWDHHDRLDAFTDAGGWVMLTGLTPAGLASFNKLVGFPHQLRRFISEKVTPAAHPPPIAVGILPDDLGMRTVTNPWAGEFMVAEDAYTWVVDTDDLAAFAKLPDYTWFKHPDGNIDHNPLNLVDGFGSGDSWKRVLALYPTRSRMDFPMTFPQAETISAIEVDCSFVYPGIRHVEFTFDGVASSAITVETPMAGPCRTILSPPRTVTVLGVRVVDWADNGRDVIGIDDIHITPRLDVAAHSKVQNITSNGAIVAYPHGRGGILLCQFGYPDTDQDPNNPGRRLRILNRLLFNAHVSKGQPHARATPPPSSIALGVPIALGADALQDLGDSAWLDPEHPGGVWPTADISGGGIAFRLGDHPHAIVRQHDQPPAVVPVGALCQALLFLHTAHSDAPTGTRLGHYTVLYDDGRHVEIPLVMGRDVADAHQQATTALDRAQLAWRGGATSQGMTSLYVRQWDNPTPGVTIVRIEVACDDPSARLALLGLTRLAPGGEEKR